MSSLGNMQIRENISSKKIRVGNSNESKNTNISVSAKISSNKIQKILYIKYGEFWSLPIALELFIEHKPPEIGNNLLQVQCTYLVHGVHWFLPNLFILIDDIENRHN